MPLQIKANYGLSNKIEITIFLTPYEYIDYQKIEEQNDN